MKPVVQMNSLVPTESAFNQVGDVIKITIVVIKVTKSDVPYIIVVVQLSFNAQMDIVYLLNGAAMENQIARIFLMSK